ncbi:aspartate/glutamate racemase family protein [Microvirga guangxiensis]|uniref:Allantoin racemase n=1 Tax=Microvirga guangxiensis TaxID=549386 RepID=A0A1G5LBU3_9HYPH|nr:aspartate/glutamate racemase family protein [Microvirga guangxiensis]SCZ09941.1 allantoin racemase [Microvirga guangxiensis]
MARILMLTLRAPAVGASDFSANLDADTQVVHRAVAVAPDTTVSAHDWALADLAVLAAGQGAESEGYDAVCVAETGDYGLGALRSVLSIPVIGAGRSAMLHALTLGNRFSILVPNSRYYRIKKLVGDYGLDRQCASVCAIGAETSDSDETTFPQILAQAQACLDEDGSDVLCLDTHSPALASRLADKLGTPVIEPISLSLKLAESFLGLHLSHSRGAYPAPQVRKQPLITAIAETR